MSFIEDIELSVFEPQRCDFVDLRLRHTGSLSKVVLREIQLELHQCHQHLVMGIHLEAVIVFFCQLVSQNRKHFQRQTRGKEAEVTRGRGSL